MASLQNDTWQEILIPAILTSGRSPSFALRATEGRLMNEEMKYLKVDTAAVVVVARRRAQPLIR